MSPDEITRLARLHLVVNDDWRIFGVEAFARAIEQAATRKALTQARPLTAACLLAKPHSGMRVDYRGLFKQARQGLRASPGIAEMLRQFEDHITELGQRWYAGDAAVVDELLQLYCVERDTRARLSDSEEQPWSI